MSTVLEDNTNIKTFEKVVDVADAGLELERFKEEHEGKEDEAELKKEESAAQDENVIKDEKQKLHAQDLENLETLDKTAKPDGLIINQNHKIGNPVQ